MGVTDEGITVLAAHCRQLLQLHVRDCFFVTSRSCDLVRESSPYCTVFDF
jgi:hypothetical protein